MKTVRDWGFDENGNRFLELSASLPPDIPAMRGMLEDGLDINACSLNGHDVLSRCLLEQFGEYNSICTRPCFFSAYEKDGMLHSRYDTSSLPGVLKLLLEFGLDVNLSSPSGTLLDTVLFGANDENTLSAAELLLQSGSDPNIADSCGENICDRANDADFEQIHIWGNAKPGLPDYYGRFCVLLSKYGGKPRMTDWPY